MSEKTDKETKKVIPQEIEDRIDQLCLFDDDFMSLVFDNNYEATEYLLNTILSRDDLKVVKIQVQKTFKNHMAKGREVTLDIFAKDSTGKMYDVEVQRENVGASPQRARYHSATIDTRMLRSRQKFTEIDESYVIFITQKDSLKGNKPIYHVERKITELGNKEFDDGAHIIYVNGAYKDDNSEIGRMVHDFGCVRASDMYSEVLKNQVRYFKETEGGREAVCEIIEEYGELKAAETAKKYEKMLDEKDKALNEKDKALNEKDKALNEKDKALYEKDKALDEKDKVLDEKDREIEQLKKELQKYKG